MLLLLHGPETWLSRQRLSELREEAAAQGALIEDVDCGERNLAEVFQELNTSSLFSQSKFIVFYDPFLAKGWEDKGIKKALLKADAHTIVFFVPGEAKKSEPLFAFLRKHGTPEEFLRLAGAKLASFAQKEIKKQGVPFTPGAADLLVSLCAQDLGRMAHEIQKLASYGRFPAGTAVREEDVLSLVSFTAEPRIFSTIDAMASKDLKTATRLLAEHLAAGEHPLQLLSMFAWQFRMLLSIKDLEARGAVRQQIAQKLKLHPFVAQKSFAAASRFSLEELRELYRRIFSLDLMFKTGKGNPEQLLYLFLGQATAKEKR
ncbi:MAG: DNA polymerase III subunit delta [bacterium]|nr:DNA polymerase III subunit delta [bacterium]